MALLSPISHQAQKIAEDNFLVNGFKPLCKMKTAVKTNFKPETGYLDVEEGEVVMVMEDLNAKKGLLTITRFWDVPAERITGRVPSIIFKFDPSSTNIYLDALNVFVEKPSILYSIIINSSNPAHMNIRDLLRSRGMLRQMLVAIFDLEISKSKDENTLFRSLTPAMLLATSIYGTADLIRYQRNLIRFLIGFALDYWKIKGVGESGGRSKNAENWDLETSPRSPSTDSSLEDSVETSGRNGLSQCERFYIFCLEGGLNFLLSENFIPLDLALVFQCLSESLSKRGPKYHKYLVIVFFLRIIVPALVQPLKIEEKAANMGLTDDPKRQNKLESIYKKKGSSGDGLPPARRSNSTIKLKSHTPADFHLDLKLVKEPFPNDTVAFRTSPPTKDSSKPPVVFKQKKIRRASVDLFSQNSKQDVAFPKINTLLQDQKIIKYLHTIAKVYQNLANGVTPTESAPLYNLTISVSYLKPVLDAYLQKMISTKYSEPEIVSPLIGEMNMFYPELLSVLKSSTDNHDQLLYHKLIDTYGPVYNTDLVERVYVYLRSKAWYQ